MLSSPGRMLRVPALGILSSTATESEGWESGTALGSALPSGGCLLLPSSARAHPQEQMLGLCVAASPGSIHLGTAGSHASWFSLQGKALRLFLVTAEGCRKEGFPLSLNGVSGLNQGAHVGIQQWMGACLRSKKREAALDLGQPRTSQCRARAAISSLYTCMQLILGGINK